MSVLNSRLSPALRIGLIFGAIGVVLTIVGIARGNVPMNPASIAMALLIGGGVWFLVSWAVATAAIDVESDLAQSEQEQEG
jgi:putative Mn2+ efflux pump MntP